MQKFSLTLFRKNFVKAMILLKRLLNSWFDVIFSVRENFSFIHTMWFWYMCASEFTKKITLFLSLFSLFFLKKKPVCFLGTVIYFLTEYLTSSFTSATQTVIYGLFYTRIVKIWHFWKKFVFQCYKKPGNVARRFWLLKEHF